MSTPERSEDSTRCPHCNSPRTTDEDGLPNAVCPACHKRYVGFASGIARDTPPPAFTPPTEAPSSAPSLQRLTNLGGEDYKTPQRILTGVAVVLAILVLASYTMKGQNIPLSSIQPALLQEPIQQKSNEPDFTFSYADEIYKVHPVASYELWGLVIAHNDIGSMWDSYHDEKSVDTKDLCVIWGENLKSEDFHRVEFKSGSWTCYVRYPGGVRFVGKNLSNNHLVTDSDDIRDAIADVRVGDQVHLKGMLVNYTNPEGWRGWWRKSSTSRTDIGGTACEVVFIESLEVLERGTPGWYALYTFGGWLLVLLILAKIGLFVHGIVKG